MARFPKPSEGSWTEHYPELGTGPVSYTDSCSAEVYALDTSDGHLLARIRVGKGPHGLCVYPQPGRYSLGHTGNMR